MEVVYIFIMIQKTRPLFKIMRSGSSNIEFRTGGTHRCTISSSGHFEPHSNNTYDLGTSSLRWANVYTNDLNLSNKGSTNSVDNTWATTQFKRENQIYS